MPGRFTLLLTAALIAAVGPAGAARSARTVFTQKDALFLGVPDVVSEGMAESGKWSADGRYVLVSRQYVSVEQALKRPPDESLILWTRTTKRAVEVWKGPFGAGRTEYQWLSGAPAAIVILPRTVPPRRPGETSATESWLHLLEPRAGKLRALARVGDDSLLIVHPRQPLAALVDPDARNVRLLRADGTIGAPVHLTDTALPASVYFTMGGLALEILEPVPGKRDAVIPNWTILDPVTGAVTRVPKQPPVLQPPSAELEVALKTAENHVQRENTKTLVRSVWLEGDTASEQPRALVTADAAWESLSPQGDAVLYGGDDGAFVVALGRIPKEVAAAAMRKARQQVIISNGKQVAVGVLMYAQDYDETLPGAGQPIIDLLQPYVKNNAVFEGLVYTFGGGNLADVAEPAKTLLGYIPGPGGKANIYVDGHVVWEPEP